MKPVLIQHLMKRNKGKYKASPMTEKEKEQYDSSLGTFVFWFVALLFIAGLVMA